MEYNVCNIDPVNPPPSPPRSDLNCSKYYEDKLFKTFLLLIVNTYIYIAMMFIQ